MQGAAEVSSDGRGRLHGQGLEDRAGVVCNSLQTLRDEDELLWNHGSLAATSFNFLDADDRLGDEGSGRQSTDVPLFSHSIRGALLTLAANSDQPTSEGHGGHEPPPRPILGGMAVLRPRRRHMGQLGHQVLAVASSHCQCRPTGLPRPLARPTRVPTNTTNTTQPTTTTNARE